MLKNFFAKPRKATKRDMSNIDVTYRKLTIIANDKCNLYSVGLPCTNGNITLTSNSPRELIDYVEFIYTALAPNVTEPINFVIKDIDNVYFPLNFILDD